MQIWLEINSATFAIIFVIIYLKMDISHIIREYAQEFYVE